MTTTDLTDLEAKAARLLAQHEKAQAAAQAARDEELQRQTERARQLDQDTVNAYSETDHAGAITAAGQQLVQAVAGSDIGQAWVAYQAAQLRQAHAAADASGAASRLGLAPIPSRPANNAAATVLAKAVDQLARNLVADELDQRDQDRAARIEAKG
ncbi:hypothetical protein SAMN04488543_1300 [Friedmanniella luteola]|uniref:Uncharacterized protein n=1 Tax=Friedmanniella luteola TaxID=546871 RepID=A0A1H1QE32_9ACTN|nr:hypothetical protein [Friedmanniella luteola]SDS21742.1 hypothetical protein SAMN04488543_1300 [Friedmanniella luteola]